MSGRSTQKHGDSAARSGEKDHATGKASKLWQETIDFKSAKFELKPKHTTYRARPVFDTYLPHPDEKTLINLLLSPGMSSDRNNFSIVAIVGVEGIGKTTIARALLNNNVVMQNFDLRSWVSLSNSSPDVYSVTKGLLEYATKEKYPPQMSPDEIQYRLQSMVYRKQCLFVLDDVWLERPSDFENLLVLFKYCAHGSKLVVTGRSTDELGVALYPNKFATIHQLQPLLGVISWMPFISKWLPLYPSYQREKLQSTLMDIVTQWGAVPLVVKILVGILQDQDINTWERVLIDESWYSTQVEEGIPNAFRFTYGRLPGHLKPCLEYFSLFPNDYSVSRKTLLSLWIAEGFVGPYDDYSAMFSSATEILDQLEHRNLIDKDIRMHNLVRELACLVCSRSYCHSEMGQHYPATCTAKNITHASILGRKIDPTDTIEWLVQAKGLHTVFVKFRPNEFFCSNFLERLPNWRSLRVIFLSEADEMELPPSIGDLQELRYLGLHMCGITSLPDSICRLSNLQTLDLESCAGLVSLPDEFGFLSSLSRLNLGKTGICSLPYSFYDLTNLWDLNVSETGISFLSDSISKLTRLEKLHIHLCPFSGMPRQFGSLTQLRHLSDYSVGDGKTWSGISELNGLNMLEGTLCISRLENIGTRVEAVAADLESKKGLSELTLQWSTYSPVNAFMFREEHDLIIAQSLQPPRHVQSVSFLDYAGDTFPRWLSELEDSFHFLHTLMLRGCIRVSTFNLPSKTMRRIEIQDCPQLDLLDLQKGDFRYPKYIDELIIVDCPNLVSIPASRLQIRRNFQVQGCSRLQIDLRDLVNGMLMLASLEQLNVQCEGTHLTFKELRVLGNQKLSYLPTGLRGMQSLQVVELNDCPLLIYIAPFDLPLNIRKLLITACPLFDYFPERMREFKSLKSLKLCNLPKLPWLRSDAIPVNVVKLHFTNCRIYEISRSRLSAESLQVLHIHDCPNLKRITDEELPDSLAELVVHDCQSLEFLTYQGIHNLSNLKTLQLTNCGKLSLSSGSLLWLSSLKELRVDYIPILESGLPPALEKLKLWGHEDLHSFPQQEWLQNLPSLQRIKIAEFPQLQFLPTNLPSALQHLSICDCPTLAITAEDMVDLKSLKKLTIMNCQLSESFCENGLPTMLVELKIMDCEELQHLPKNLNTLTFLESMTISNCRELELRSEDKLPDNLSALKITNCPKLALKGKEWASSSWNMEHIPFRYIS